MFVSLSPSNIGGAGPTLDLTLVLYLRFLLDRVRTNLLRVVIFTNNAEMRHYIALLLSDTARNRLRILLPQMNHGGTYRSGRDLVSRLPTGVIVL